MIEKKINLLAPYPLQEEIMNDTHRFRVLSCGRRWGKTLLAMEEAFNMLVKKYLQTGIRQRGWVVAPTFPLVREDWLQAEYLLKDAIISKHQTDMRMDFGKIGFLEFKSAEREDEGLRGAGLDCCVVDEASRVSRKSWEQGLRPALADKQGRCLFISTPKGRNWFFDLYQQGQQGNPDIMSWRYPTYLNPYFPPKEWDIIKATTPDMILKQEYEADFLEDEATVFHNVGECIWGTTETPLDNEYYSLGLDLGRTEDFTVLTALRNSTKQVVDIMRFNKVDWSLQKEQVKAFCSKFKRYILYVDSTGLGDPIEDDLRKSGVNTRDYKFSNASKEKLIEQLIVAIEQKLIKIPNEFKYKFLIDELKAFTYERLPSGSFRYTAPSGLHDDGVISLGLSVMGIAHILYTRPKEEQPKKTWGTADDWDKYYDELDHIQNKNPYMDRNTARKRWDTQRLKRLLNHSIN